MKKYIAIAISMLCYGSLNYAQTLEDYYRIAAENNPGLHAMYQEYEAAMQKVPQVSSLPDPTFSFGYFIFPVETRVGPQKARLSLSQMFPWFGTLKAQGNAAALMAEAKYQAFLDARNQLYFQVSSAICPLYELKEWIRLEQENIDLLESYKSIANQNFINGKGSMVDVLRADIRLKDAQTSLAILRDKEKPLLTSFNALLNRPATDAVNISDTLQVEIIADNFRKDSLMASNPKLEALSLKFHSFQAVERAAQKLGQPKLGIGLDYVLVGERTDLSLPGNGKNALMPMVSISLPIIRSKYKAAVREAQFMQESYKFQKLEVMNTLVSDYETAWFQVQQQEQMLSLYEEQIQITQQSLSLLFTSYGNSGEDFDEVLRMQQQLLQYRKMKANALTQYRIAVDKINYLTSKSY